SVWLALKVWGPGSDPLSLWERVRVRARPGDRRFQPRTPDPGLGLAWVLVTAALLYTQYFAATVVVFEGLAFAALFWRVRRTWRWWLVWFGLNATVFLLYLPWLRETFVQISGWPSISESFSLPQLVQRVFLVFSFGLSWDNTATGRMVAFFA